MKDITISLLFRFNSITSQNVHFIDGRSFNNEALIESTNVC